MSKAREQTRIVTGQADIAMSKLSAGFDGRILNGWGELADPSYARGCLVDARRAIDTALAALNAAESVGWSRDREDAK